ncbi:serine protease [Patescibacteria group bacterium]|nr:serine protease [Patescibacteria group bacterium]
MPKRILLLLLLFLAGAVGGLWSQAFLLPSLAANPAFQNWQFLKDWNARTQVIAPVEQIFVRENEAVQRTIQQIKGTVVALKSAGARQGSGLVYTSDGLIVTLSSLVPDGWKVTVYPEGQDSLPAKILKRDVASNLVLLKIEDAGLKTAGFVKNGGVELGERVVLLAKIVEADESTLTVNVGVVKKIEEDSLVTSIVEQENVDGAPLFNVEGRVVGLADADLQGNIFVIPSLVLREFLGL